MTTSKSTKKLNKNINEIENQLIRTEINEVDFFIASNSCDPGGARHHANICLTDFDDAFNFAKNNNCYDVLVIHGKCLYGNTK